MANHPARGIGYSELAAGNKTYFDADSMIALKVGTFSIAFL